MGQENQVEFASGQQLQVKQVGYEEDQEDEIKKLATRCCNECTADNGGNIFDCLDYCIRDKMPNFDGQRLECFKEHAPNVNWNEWKIGCMIFKDKAKCAKCRGIDKCPLMFPPCPPGIKNSHPSKHPVNLVRT